MLPAPRFTRYLLWMLLRRYGSRSFFIGLFGLVLLLMAWISPWIPNISLFYNSGTRIYSLEKNLGEVGFFRMENTPEAYGWLAEDSKPGSFWSFKAPPAPYALRIPAISRIAGPGLDGVKISCWFILTVYTATWFAFQVWWHRRKRRLMNGLQ